ncbi:MAG: HepT-like ribonuclease domain-containing protein [Campylobacterota bacterium]|nr:HepT-like ribonuclease domain-containing protein [Campylobacterota bacterium]
MFVDRFNNIYSLLNDKMGFDATLMSLLQIGETLNKLENDYELLDKNDIKGAYDVGNFIAHDYEGVNKALVESITRMYIPKLKETLSKILTS